MMIRTSAIADSLEAPSAEPLAVLVSGGLDSCILVGEALRTRPAVYPLYIRCGLFWEEVEQQYLRQFLRALPGPALQPLQVLQLPTADLYDRHWSVTGQEVPDAGTSDEAVFLPGRNVLLLCKALLWCHLHQVPAVALAPLQGNPFPDATPEFFAAMAAVVNQAVEGQVRVLQPYRRMHKVEVLRRGRGMPLQWTFSCIRPTGGKHCGACNKCSERRQAFRDAGLPDPTPYFQEGPCSA